MQCRQISFHQSPLSLRERELQRKWLMLAQTWMIFQYGCACEGSPKGISSNLDRKGRRNRLFFLVFKFSEMCSVYQKQERDSVKKMWITEEKSCNSLHFSHVIILNFNDCWHISSSLLFFPINMNNWCYFLSQATSNSWENLLKASEGRDEKLFV